MSSGQRDNCVCNTSVSALCGCTERLSTGLLGDCQADNSALLCHSRHCPARAGACIAQGPADIQTTEWAPILRCTGWFYDNEHVITAGHCVYNNDKREYYVVPQNGIGGMPPRLTHQHWHSSQFERPWLSVIVRLGALQA